MDAYPESGSYQAAEVRWYKVHGLHKDRVQKDGSGREYVIGDDAWNRDGRPSEYIERRMRNELGVL